MGIGLTEAVILQATDFTAIAQNHMEDPFKMKSAEAVALW